MNRVFISYSNHDSAVADAVCASIEAAGRTCWIAPRDIEPSSEWAEQIIDGINTANLMVLVFSSWSNRSPQVRREVERAINRDIPVIPFRIEKVLPVKSLEYFLSTQHWFDAFEGAVEAHLARLCALVQTLSRRADAQAQDGMTATDTAAWTDSGCGPVPICDAGPPATPQPRAYRDDDLAFVTHELARHIGPIARYLVQRASGVSASPSALIDTLAAELAEPGERAAFVATCRRRLAA